MLKTLSIICLLNLVNSQYRLHRNNIKWQSSPAKSLLPKIFNILNNFRETFEKETTNGQKISTIESVQKNCQLLGKLSHRTGRNFLQHCLGKAYSRKNTTMNYVISEKIGLKKKQEHAKRDKLSRQKMLKLYKNNARKHLQELEELYRNIVMLKTHHGGFARLA